MSSKKRTGRVSPAEESLEGSSASGVKGAKSKAGSGKKPPNAGKAPRNRETGEWAGPGSRNPERRCSATARRSGEQCKQASVLGTVPPLCKFHGGALPGVKKAAKERLLELVDPALAALHKVLSNPDADDSVKVRAALGILDRTGHGPGSKLEVEVGLTKWEQAMVLASGGEIIDGKAVFPDLRGKHGVQRQELDGPDDRPALGRGVGSEDTWEDAEQHAYDERERQWAEYDAEDSEPYRTRIESSGPVVRGEVVNNDPPDYSRGR